MSVSWCLAFSQFSKTESVWYLALYCSHRARSVVYY